MATFNFMKAYTFELIKIVKLFLRALKLKTTGLLLILISFSALQCTQEKERPNLLIIQTDEHNFRTLGCYREQLSHDQAFVWGDGNNVETPNIDFLAEYGVLFTKFYAATPVCSPSRGSLISGSWI